MRFFVLLVASALLLMSCQDPVSSVNSDSVKSRSIGSGTLVPLYPYQFGSGTDGGMSLTNVEQYVQLNADEAVVGLGATEINHNIVYLEVRAVKINADGSLGTERTVYSGIPHVLEKQYRVPEGYLLTGFSIGESNDAIRDLVLRSRRWDPATRKLVGSETNTGTDVLSSELNFFSNNSILMSRNLPGAVPYDPDLILIAGIGLRAVTSHMNNGVVYLTVAPGTPFTP